MKLAFFNSGKALKKVKITKKTKVAKMRNFYIIGVSDTHYSSKFYYINRDDGLIYFKNVLQAIENARKKGVKLSEEVLKNAYRPLEMAKGII